MPAWRRTAAHGGTPRHAATAARTGGLRRLAAARPGRPADGPPPPLKDPSLHLPEERGVAWRSKQKRQGAPIEAISKKTVEPPTPPRRRRASTPPRQHTAAPLWARKAASGQGGSVGNDVAAGTGPEY